MLNDDLELDIKSRIRVMDPLQKADPLLCKFSEDKNCEGLLKELTSKTAMMGKLYQMIQNNFKDYLGLSEAEESDPLLIEDSRLEEIRDSYEVFIKS